VFSKGELNVLFQSHGEEHKLFAVATAGKLFGIWVNKPIQVLPQVFHVLHRKKKEKKKKKNEKKRKTKPKLKLE